MEVVLINGNTNITQTSHTLGNKPSLLIIGNHILARLKTLYHSGS
jgi:hypothetical protein